MKKILFYILVFLNISISFSQDKVSSNEIVELRREIQKFEQEKEYLKKEYDSLSIQYQHTNDRLNNYLTYTGIVASIFGVLIALAGIYIGFESLRSQKRRKEAIDTLEEAKKYVQGKTNEFDSLLEKTKSSIEEEYSKIIDLLKDKLASDIEIETTKIREIAQKKTKEIETVSIEMNENATIELLEKRLEFFENVSIPDDPKILISKAKILSEKNNHEGAIELLERIISKDEKHKEAYWYLGYEFSKLNQTNKAIENYIKAIEINPKNSAAYNNLALEYKIKEKLLDALENFNQAIKIDPNKEFYYTNRIDVLQKLNNTSKVIENYIKLIELNPTKEGYYNRLIILLNKEKRISEAIRYCDDAIEAFKDNTELVDQYEYFKAYVLGENNNEEDAIIILQKLIDKSYKTESCYIKIADLKYKQGKIDDAKEILNNGLNYNPLSSNLYIHKANIESAHSIEDAKKTLHEGAQKINDENFYYAAARFLQKKGHLDLSKYCYEKIFDSFKEKIENESTESDLMNFYEVNIILGKDLNLFNIKYRSKIVTEKYLITLSVLDIITKLTENNEIEDKLETLDEIERLKLEAKDLSKLNWNFEDIYFFVENNYSNQISELVASIIKYVKNEISFEQLKLDFKK